MFNVNSSIHVDLWLLSLPIQYYLNFCSSLADLAAASEVLQLPNASREEIAATNHGGMILERNWLQGTTYPNLRNIVVQKLDTIKRRGLNVMLLNRRASTTQNNQNPTVFQFLNSALYAFNLSFLIYFRAKKQLVDYNRSISFGGNRTCFRCSKE